MKNYVMGALVVGLAIVNVMLSGCASAYTDTGSATCNDWEDVMLDYIELGATCTGVTQEELEMALLYDCGDSVDCVTCAGLSYDDGAAECY